MGAILISKRLKRQRNFLINKIQTLHAPTGCVMDLDEQSEMIIIVSILRNHVLLLEAAEAVV